MKPIHLVPLAGSGPNGRAGANPEPGIDLLEHLAAALARMFRAPCRIRPQTLDLAFALDPARGQYYSSAILQRIERTCDPDARVLGVAVCDLYVPVLTFVFGEAQLDGNCAVVSVARLSEEFYGLPRREEVLRQRLVKEAVTRVGPHVRPAPLPGLALRDDLQPCRRADRRERGRLLRPLPEGGPHRRVLVESAGVTLRSSIRARPRNQVAGKLTTAAWWGML